MAPPRVRFGLFLLAGLAVAVTLAFFVGPRASTEPDGLDRVAIDHGFAPRDVADRRRGAPVSGYRVAGIRDRRLATGVAGLIGVGVTFLVGAGLVGLVRRSARDRAGPDAPAPGKAD